MEKIIKTTGRQTMSNMIKWLSDNGFKFETVRMTNGTNGILVDTNYNGMYPTKETWTQQDTITNYNAMNIFDIFLNNKPLHYI
jgi:hypothetical protein